MKTLFMGVAGAVLCALLAGGAPPAAWADEADDAYNALYKKKVDDALTTWNKEDDAAVARELLAASKKEGTSPRLARC